jgi:hypothetical protein
MAVGQPTATTQVYSCTIVTSDPKTGIIQAVLPGAIRPVTVQGTPIAFRWPVAGEAWRIININSNFYLDAPLPIQDNSSTDVMSTTIIQLATTSEALAFNQPITDISVNALAQPISQSVFTITDPTGAYSQVWATSGAAEGDTEILVNSQYTTYGFPAGSIISGSGITTINDIDPGDAVINSPTGKIWVMGDSTGTNDFNFDVDSFVPPGEIPATSAQVTAAVAHGPLLRLQSIGYYTGWADYGGGFTPPAIWKTPDNMVHARGLVNCSAGGNTSGNYGPVMIPAAYRPGGLEIFSVLSSQGSIRGGFNDSSGVLEFSFTLNSSTWISLGGMQWLAGE